ncbi:MAG: arylmalonate decarboxylase [Alphaproteobacteria bacterium]|nr:arylmalonate decarboxylase [Alphaproteobacteria bacterium]
MTDTIGYRAVIGALVPYTNTICQAEFEALKPEGVVNATARIKNYPRPTHDEEAYRQFMAKGPHHLEETIDTVTPAEPDLILLGHSIDSFAGGVKGATALQERLSKHAKVCPVLVPSLALRDALHALGGCKRLAVLTPYLKPGGDQAAAFLTDAGFQVQRVKNLACKTGVAIARVSHDEMRNAVRELDGADVDAIVQAGTNLAFQSVAAEAEPFVRKPVLSINTAVYWYGLRFLKINDRLHGFGRLMQNH